MNVIYVTTKLIACVIYVTILSTSCPEVPGWEVLFQASFGLTSL